MPTSLCYEDKEWYFDIKKGVQGAGGRKGDCPPPRELFSGVMSPQKSVKERVITNHILILWSKRQKVKKGLDQISHV